MLAAYVSHCASTSEETKGSTWWEMCALMIALRFFIPILQGRVVKWYTDSKNVVSIIQKGFRAVEYGCCSLYSMPGAKYCNRAKMDKTQ